MKALLGNIEEHYRGSNCGPQEPEFSNKNFEETNSRIEIIEEKILEDGSPKCLLLLSLVAVVVGWLTSF